MTDLPLTPFGRRQMEATGKQLINTEGRTLIDPKTVRLIITSPRKRAIQTRNLIFSHLPATSASIPTEIDEDIREWEYGDYEGLLTKQIIDLRKERGLEHAEDWTIWQYGCENGEDSEQVTDRVDNIITKIQKIHEEYLQRNEECDIMVIAHGHILRCFAARWIGLPINQNPKFMLDAGGVCVLSYQHHNIKEPAMFLTGAFTVPIEEEGADI